MVFYGKLNLTTKITKDTKKHEEGQEQNQLIDMCRSILEFLQRMNAGFAERESITLNSHY